jgi:Domain of unknown function (DUF5134)
MSAPGWLAPVLAAVMLLIAAGSLARLVLWRLRGRAAEPEADALHAAMGVAMAGMLEPRILPVSSTAWLGVFAAAGAWFAVRAIRARSRRHDGSSLHGRAGRWGCAHPAPHAVECAAMVYMLGPARDAGHGPVMAMAGITSAAPTANPALTLLLALFMLGYTVWTADRLTSQTRPPLAAAGRGGALAPRAAACSRIAMSLAMGYMLLMTL